MPQYRKKPVVIDAVQFDGTPAGACAVFEVFGIPGAKFQPSLDLTEGDIVIPTTMGPFIAKGGDYICREQTGPFYVIKKEIFEGTYEAASSASEMTRLPDGSGFFTASYPLPKDHWIYEETGEPPMPLQMGVSPDRKEYEALVRLAAYYAIRGATRSGKAMDFDPDALVQDLIVGLFGYHTADGSSHDDDALHP